MNKEKEISHYELWAYGKIEKYDTYSDLQDRVEYFIMLKKDYRAFIIFLDDTYMEVFDKVADRVTYKNKF